MNNRALYINDQRVDLPDSVNFNLVWQVAEPGVLKIYGSGSSTIKLPFTPTNNRILAYAKIVNVNTDKPFTFLPNCRYYESGILMFDNGQAYILAVDSDYEICVTWGNTDLVQALKDTPLYDKVIGAFKWDNSEWYPLAETSENPGNYPTFFQSTLNENTNLWFKHAMTRPLVEYSKVLAVAGINKETLPERIYNALSYLYLQVNGTQAVGYYSVAGRIENRLAVGSSTNVDNSSCYMTCCCLNGNDQEQYPIQIENSGIYNITIEHAYNKEGEYEDADGKLRKFSGYCYFIVDEFYGKEIQIGRNGIISKVFTKNGDEQSYETMYRFENGIILNNQPISPYAVGYINCNQTEQPLQLKSADPKTFLSPDVVLPKKSYYIYVCPYKTVARTMAPNPDGFDNWMLDYMAELNILSKATFMEISNPDSVTKIERPDDLILITNPPDKITMLGYSTAAEIVEDFISLFPLMCYPKKVGLPNLYELHYFGFQEVFDNMSHAYDWSNAYIKHTKVDFGNTNVAMKNHVKFASYGDYTGIRANGSFAAFSAKSIEKDYAELKNIANYDYMCNLEYQIGNKNYKNKIGEYPLAKVSEKDGEYQPAGINNIPAILFWLNVPIKAIDSYILYNVLAADDSYINRNTFDYIVDRYWIDFVNVVSKQRTITIECHLSPALLTDFDYTRPIYFKQIANYVFAQKITYKGNGIVTLEGIILPSTNHGEVLPTEDGMIVDASNVYLVDNADNYIVEQ